MRTRSTTDRECPYCGHEFRLEECCVVSKPGRRTRTVNAVHGQSVHQAANSLDGASRGEEEPALSDSEPQNSTEAQQTGVLYNPASAAPPDTKQAGLVKWLSWSSGPSTQMPTFPLLSSFDPALLPRRRCPKCLETLPVQIDDMPTRIVSIVGLNVAGKSNFLGAAMHLARSGGLEEFGVTEFSADPDTATTFQANYYLPLFRQGEELKGTAKDWDVARKPLSFSVTLDGSQFLLVTHDVSGELLVDHDSRAIGAGFVRRSLGIVFILDPTEFDDLRATLPPEQLEVDRPIDQAELLGQVLGELTYRNVPVAITIAKSDLLAKMCRGASFLDDRTPGPVTTAQLQTVSDEVKDFLVSVGQKKIVDIATAYGRCTFHAVSSLGTDKSHIAIRGVKPVRVLEPLGVVLRRMASGLN